MCVGGVLPLCITVSHTDDAACAFLSGFNQLQADYVPRIGFTHLCPGLGGPDRRTKRSRAPAGWGALRVGRGLGEEGWQLCRQGR